MESPEISKEQLASMLENRYMIEIIITDPDGNMDRIAKAYPKDLVEWVEDPELYLMSETRKLAEQIVVPKDTRKPNTPW